MLPRDLIAKVRKIEIRTRKLVEDLTGGAYHSVFKGRGIEFSEVREYTPEDDVRDIDWNVTARMGHPFIKRFIEERELTAERVNMIEACIVRLMKRNRKMLHNELMQAVITALSSRFSPNVQMVKKTIESLIEREYIARSEVKKDEYVYLE